MAQGKLDLDHFRHRLERMRSETQGEIDRWHDEVVTTNDQGDFGASNHPADEATQTFDRERNMAVEAELQRELEQIDHALARVADGSYGVCEVGGEEIPVERLEARPAATLCIVHQRERDAQANQNV